MSLAADKRKHGRSAVTNGRKLLENAPKGSPTYRRYRDITLEVIGDLGGEEVVSEGQRALARRAGAICAQCEVLESQLVNNGTLIDDAGSVTHYAALVNVLNRTFSNLGLKRRMKDVSKPFGIRAEFGLE